MLAMLIFTGCTTPAADPAFYFKFGDKSAITEGDDKGLLEVHEYEVTREYEQSSIITSPFLVGTGKYIVKIYSLENAEYKVTTDFSITGKFILKNDQGEEVYKSNTFTDTITGESYFKLEAFALTAISSVKTYKHSYVINAEEEDVNKSYYRITSQYKQEDGKTILNSKFEDLAEEGVTYVPAQTEANKAYTTSVMGRYIDGEQMFLMIRLQDIGTTFKDSFYAFDPFNAPAVALKFNVSKVMGTTQKEADSLTTVNISGDKYDIGGFKPADGLVKAIELTASLNNKYSGQPIMMKFSKDLKYNFESLGGTSKSVDLQLLLEFKQENLVYKLVKYENTAVKAQ